MFETQQLSPLYYCQEGLLGAYQLCYLVLYKFITFVFSQGVPEKASKTFRFKCLHTFGVFCYQSPLFSSIEKYGYQQGLLDSSWLKSWCVCWILPLPMLPKPDWYWSLSQSFKRWWGLRIFQLFSIHEDLGPDVRSAVDQTLLFLVLTSIAYAPALSVNQLVRTCNSDFLPANTSMLSAKWMMLMILLPMDILDGKSWKVSRMMFSRNRLDNVWKRKRCWWTPTVLLK